MPPNRSVSDVQEKRRSWNGTMSGINAEHLVFLDESGINTNLTRLYAHALHWKRAVDAAPLNTPTATTVLSSIRLDGTTIFTTVQSRPEPNRENVVKNEILSPKEESPRCCWTTWCCKSGLGNNKHEWLQGGGSTHLEFALIKRIAIIMAQIETDKKVLSFHRLRYKQMLMLEKSWFYNRTSFFVYSWTNGVPVLWERTVS